MVQPYSIEHLAEPSDADWLRVFEFGEFVKRLDGDQYRELKDSFAAEYARRLPWLRPSAIESQTRQLLDDPMEHLRRTQETVRHLLTYRDAEA